MFVFLKGVNPGGRVLHLLGVYGTNYTPPNFNLFNKILNEFKNCSPLQPVPSFCVGLVFLLFFSKNMSQAITRSNIHLKSLAFRRNGDYFVGHEIIMQLIHNC